MWHRHSCACAEASSLRKRAPAGVPVPHKSDVLCHYILAIAFCARSRGEADLRAEPRASGARNTQLTRGYVAVWSEATPSQGTARGEADLRAKPRASGAGDAQLT